VARHADLRLRSELCARVARVAILLAEMDAVGAEPLGEADAVIDDERHVTGAADLDQRRRERSDAVIVDPLQPQLERAAGPRPAPPPAGRRKPSSIAGGEIR
jgi:hypothetical protein